MVKVGFIVEGHCEKAVLSSKAFQAYLSEIGILNMHEIQNARGKTNLLNDTAKSQAQIARDKGAEHIIVLRDLDNLPDLEAAESEVIQATDLLVCVAVQELEAWFLADSATISAVFKTDFFFDYPEKESKPSDTLDMLSRQYRQGRGIDDKRKFTNLMLAKGFTIQQAAQHPNCPSAKYFLTKLKNLTISH
jgi:Domain of unknown function (DUF4276)